MAKIVGCDLPPAKFWRASGTILVPSKPGQPAKAIKLPTTKVVGWNRQMAAESLSAAIGLPATAVLPYLREDQVTAKP